MKTITEKRSEKMETSVKIREADLKEQIAYMKTILNERQYRCYLGTPAISLGRGDQALVARFSGSSIIPYAKE